MSRSLSASDISLLEALHASCCAVDGGRHLTAIELYGLESTAWPPETRGVFSEQGELIAAATICYSHRPDCYRALIVGQVHPSHRGRGVGRDLLAWSLQRAEALLSSFPHDRARIQCVITEALTPDAERLYARFGLPFTFAEDVMRRSLEEPLPERPLPPDVSIHTWTVALATAFFTAYAESFHDRPGFPEWPRQRWIEWATGDEQFRPNASFLACREDRPVGFLVADRGRIVQLGVRPEDRGKGIGGALCVAAMQRLREEGCNAVELDVNVNNPTARSVYEGLGFKPVGRRARYEREA